MGVAGGFVGFRVWSAGRGERSARLAKSDDEDDVDDDPKP